MNQDRNSSDDPLECVGCGILAGAVFAKLDQMRSSKIKNYDVVLENIFISRVTNKTGEWDESDVRSIQRLSKSKDFRERFARALEHGRAPMFDKVDIFVLRNWFGWNDTVSGAPADMPGLVVWTPRAACSVMQFAGIEEASHGEQWYTTRRKRLGLSGKNRHQYRVKDFVELPGGGGGQIIYND